MVMYLTAINGGGATSAGTRLHPFISQGLPRTSCTFHQFSKKRYLIMKRKRKQPRRLKRNFGFGKMLLYALCVALDVLYGRKDHFGTRRSHKIRIRVFAEYCRRHGIKDARSIDSAIVDGYCGYLRHRLDKPFTWPDGAEDKSISVAYAHNLISTVNTAMYAIRRDDRLRVSARAKLGVARSYIRKTEIKADIEDAKTAADLMIATGLGRGAAVVMFARTWGMRVQEALLQDLDRMRREVEQTGGAAILEGCKGGRKCRSRTIEADPRQREALEFALSVRPEGSKCLLSETDNVVSFTRKILSRCRRILKKCGIPTFRELRCGFAEDVYEAIVGGPSPLRGPIGNFVLDRIAREEVARLLGHGRYQVASSYIGGY